MTRRFGPRRIRLDVAQLQPQLLVKAIDPLRMDRPAIPLQQNMNPTIAVADPGLADLLDPVFEVSLLAPLGLVDVKRPIDPQRPAGAPRRNFPVAPHAIHKLALARRFQSFFCKTSWSIALSSDRSATIRLSFAFYSSSCRSRFISVGNSPAYFFRQL